MIKEIGKKIGTLLFIATFVLLSPMAWSQINIGDDLSTINYERPSEYVIGGITVSGAEFVNEHVIIMLSELDLGTKIKVPGDNITGAIRKLWAQGLFESISITATKIQGNKIFLDINLLEKPRLSKFSFDGIRKAEADDIREKINLSRGDVLSDHLLIRTKNIIKEHYASKGYLNSEVTFKEKPNKKMANFEDLVIGIKKNKKVKIGVINIYGNEEVSDGKLYSTMKETKKRGYFNPLNPLGPLVLDLTADIATLKFKKFQNDIANYISDNYKVNIMKGSKYIESSYEDDLNMIVAKYNQMGYRDAHIISDSVYTIDKQNIGIDITIEEGNKYYFRKIDWVGNTIYTSEFLSKILGIRKGDVYNKELLETNLNYNPMGFDISSLYMDNGYLFFSAMPMEVYVSNDSIDLEIRIFEGKQARINKVTIQGNEKTNDHVVIRELRTVPGQLFSRSDIIRSTRELANLQYFNAETIQPDVRPNAAEGTVDVIYKVEETSADQIELSGGWGYGRVIGTIGLKFNNFSLNNFFKKDAWRPIPSGDGQKLALRFQTYGKDYMSWSVSFTEPWLGGKKPNALSVSYFHSLYTNRLPKSDTNYASFIIDGVTVGIGKRLQWPDDFFTLYQGLNFQRYKLQNYSTIFPIGSGTGTYHNFSYEINLGRNSISQPIYPRSGSDISLGLEVTPPYSLFSDKDYSNLDDTDKWKWIEYHKWKAKAYWYFELMDKLVLATKFRFGYLGHYNSELGTTPFERFYLGGDGMSGMNNFDGRELIGMRGYANESVTPLYYKDKNIGGTVFTRYTLELRYPISLAPTSTIYAQAFFEAGNSWLGAYNFDPFNLKRSAGFGVRVFLPMFGMLGLDWAYGFDDIRGISSASGSHFHFSMNQSLD